MIPAIAEFALFLLLKLYSLGSMWEMRGLWDVLVLEAQVRWHSWPLVLPYSGGIHAQVKTCWAKAPLSGLQCNWNGTAGSVHCSESTPGKQRGQLDFIALANTTRDPSPSGSSQQGHCPLQNIKEHLSSSRAIKTRKCTLVKTCCEHSEGCGCCISFQESEKMSLGSVTAPPFPTQLLPSYVF